MPVETDIADPVAVRIVADLHKSSLAVLGLLTEGMRNKDIAARMGTTEQVIKNRLRDAYDATGMGSRLELALFVLAHPMLRQAADEALRKRLA